MTPVARWNWFKHTKYYTQGTFNKKWNQIKKENNKPTPPPPTSPQHKRTFANKFAMSLFKYEYDNKVGILIDIPNMISDHDLAPATLHKFRIGECVQSIFAM